MYGTLLKLLRRRRMERDLEEEMRFHREMAAAHGNETPFGNITAIEEEARELWRFAWIENLWRDFAYAVRGLRRSPALVASALLSLTLGIGANTAIFSLGMEFLFSEPSVREPSSIVSIRLGGNSHSKQEALKALRESGIFEEIVGWNEEGFANWNDGNETRRVFLTSTTKNWFTALGVPMAYGRGYSESDTADVAVLKNSFWRKHFNGDPSIVGRAINLDGRPHTVAGILPEVHRTLLGFGYAPDIYAPSGRPETLFSIYARLRPGMTIGQARAGLQTFAERLDETMPERWKYARGVRLEPVAGWQRLRREKQIQTVGVFFAILLAVVGLVLLIACVNVASLLLARASARRRETAIRLALGASRRRLLQQMLVESLLLSALGAACGLGLSQWIASTLADVPVPLPIPIRLTVELDWRVALYAALLASVATVVAGLLPAAQALKESIISDFRREGKMRLRRGLVIAQIAISVVVLSTGFLFLRNLMQTHAMSPGFDIKRTLRAEVHLPRDAYKDRKRISLFIEQSLRAIDSTPGIEASAAARIVPFTDATTHTAGLTFPDNGEKVNARFHWNMVTPDFFRAMNIPLIAGRPFTETAQGTHSVVVNRVFVRRFLGRRNPVGAVFLWGEEGKTPYEIAGVAEVTKNLTIGEDDQPQIYESLLQMGTDRTRLQFVMRSATPPATQLDPIRKVLRAVEPGAGIEVSTMYSSIGLAFLPSQIGALLMGSMGGLGLLLAMIGLYGVMVYMVTRRTREIGVRMAIGAGRSQISRMVLRDAAKLMLIGSIVGLSIALFVTRPLAMFLVPGITPSDPLTFTAVIAVLILTGIVSSWGPVRRAAAVDPVSSLRHD